MHTCWLRARAFEPRRPGNDRGVGRAAGLATVASSSTSSIYAAPAPTRATCSGSTRVAADPGQAGTSPNVTRAVGHPPPPLTAGSRPPTREEDARDRHGPRQCEPRGGTTVARLASVAGMERADFCVAFKRSTGTTPHRFIVRRRVEEGMRLLCTGNAKIARIAAPTGFANPSHLTRVFRELVGTTPVGFSRQVAAVNGRPSHAASASTAARDSAARPGGWRPFLAATRTAGLGVPPRIQKRCRFAEADVIRGC